MRFEELVVDDSWPIEADIERLEGIVVAVYAEIPGIVEDRVELDIERVGRLEIDTDKELGEELW